MSNNTKAVNMFGLAMGTAAHCATCRILMTYGVNSKQAMNEVAKVTGHATYGDNWAAVLADHARYHAHKGEELPAAYLPTALTPEFKAEIAVVHKPVAPKPIDQFKAACARLHVRPLKR